MNTNLHWAERLDDSRFRYGEIAGVNTTALEGVPSMDRNGISNRSYNQIPSTVYRGKFSAGAVSRIELVPGVSAAKPGIVNFDAEICPDGTPCTSWRVILLRANRTNARILIARRDGNGFVRADDTDSIMGRSISGV